MKKNFQEILDNIEKLAEKDSIYQHMLEENKILEERFDHFVKGLPEEQRSILWDFVMHCEDMSLRKLELACTLILK